MNGCIKKRQMETTEHRTFNFKHYENKIGLLTFKRNRMNKINRLNSTHINIIQSLMNKIRLK